MNIDEKIEAAAKLVASDTFMAGEKSPFYDTIRKRVAEQIRAAFADPTPADEPVPCGLCGKDSFWSQYAPQARMYQCGSDLCPMFKVRLGFADWQKLMCSRLVLPLPAVSGEPHVVTDSGGGSVRAIVWDLEFAHEFANLIPGRRVLPPISVAVTVREQKP